MTPTNTLALLPPDPSVPGRYWIRNAEGRDVIGVWNPSGHWTFIGWRTLASPVRLALAGYTLATPHPIPGPAALEAVWEALAIMEKEAERLTTAMRNDFDSGVQSGMDSAAAHLRAALETKETTDG